MTSSQSLAFSNKNLDFWFLFNGGLFGMGLGESDRLVSIYF